MTNQKDIFSYLVPGKCAQQAFLFVAVAFAQLPLGAVAVHGVTQSSLRHAEQDFHAGRAGLRLDFSIDQAERINGGGPAAGGKELFDFAKATQVFGFGKGGSHDGWYLQMGSRRAAPALASFRRRAGM